MTRVRLTLVVGAVVLAEAITLGAGWHIGTQTRRQCEALAHQRGAEHGSRHVVQECVTARLFHGGA